MDHTARIGRWVSQQIESAYRHHREASVPPAKAVGYMSDGSIVETSQEAFTNEGCGPEWPSPST